MNEKAQQELLLKWRQILGDLDIPFYLNQSTCLGIYRDGKLLAPNRSIDLAILDEDMTPEKYEILKKYEYHTVKVCQPYGIFYFEINQTKEISGCEVQIVYFKDKWAFYNLSTNVCVVWDRKHLERKNWRKMIYMDLEWNIPGDPANYLKHTYGENWSTPIGSWNWIAQQTNLCSWESIMAGKPIIGDYLSIVEKRI